jgi:hypothetical protein
MGQWFSFLDFGCRVVFVMDDKVGGVVRLGYE